MKTRNHAGQLGRWSERFASTLGMRRMATVPSGIARYPLESAPIGLEARVQRTTLRTALDMLPVALLGLLELWWLAQSVRVLLSQSTPTILFLMQFAHRLTTVMTVLRFAGVPHLMS